MEGYNCKGCHHVDCNCPFYIKPVIKKPHGGKRKGSGRKKGEPTKVIRVRVSKLDEIKKINES